MPVPPSIRLSSNGRMFTRVPTISRPSSSLSRARPRPRGSAAPALQKRQLISKSLWCPTRTTTELPRLPGSGVD